jgi:glycine amidinotransferase
MSLDAARVGERPGHRARRRRSEEVAVHGMRNGVATEAERPIVPKSQDDAAQTTCAASAGGCPVASHNEWDPLEEVIVGRLEGATIPSSHPIVYHNLPAAMGRALAVLGGLRYPRLVVRRAQRQLDGFVALLESLGVTVRRPEPMAFKRGFRTPAWSSRGFCNSCPRDNLLVIGDEIIEAPMAWRCRYFENWSYRRGARWTAAPRPELADALFDPHYRVPGPDEPLRYTITEFEPVFDAADFVRCGRDLFVLRSNVTNRAGIEWLRRHLGDGYRIHEFESRCRTPMHVDTTLLPLAPGRLLVNPDYVDIERLPPLLRSWDILVAPEPDPITDPVLRLLSMCGRWLSMNVLSIDSRRVIVDSHHTGMIRALESWGFEPIPCPFLYYAPFGGAFHCATLDVRRRGTLESYF